MIAHLAASGVLAGLGMTGVGGLLHAAVFSVLTDATCESQQVPLRRRVSPNSRNTHTARRRY